jgi:large subunit ribosomal protein L3
MAGHMGDERVTVKNLTVFESNADRGLLLIEGSVPGAINGLVRLRKTGRKKKGS